MSKGEIYRAAELIAYSPNTLALTGAGISHASGLPTFRGRSGVWSNRSIVEWAHRQAFDADSDSWYEVYWEYYKKRKNLSPTLAHYALRGMIDSSYISTVITQNIDGFDRQAGIRDERVLELHGHDRSLGCPDCMYQIETDVWLDKHAKELTPRCPDDHTMKPTILLFGSDSVAGLEQVRANASSLLHDASALMVVGSSLEIPYVADWVLNFADRRDELIIINPERTLADSVAKVVIRDAADIALPQLRDILAA